MPRTGSKPELVVGPHGHVISDITALDALLYDTVEDLLVAGDGVTLSRAGNQLTIATSALYEPAPDELANLVVWLKADAITGKADNDAISQWNDSSGLGNHFVQATGARQGIYKVGIQNGLPTVRLSNAGGAGNEDFMQSTAAVAMGSAGGITVFVVCAIAAGTAMLLESSANVNLNNGTFAVARQATGSKPNVSIRGITNVHDFIGQDAMPATATIVTNWADLTNGAVHESYGFMNGKSFHPGTLGGTYYTKTTGPFTNQTWYLGARAGTSLFATADFFEVIAYNRALTVAERRGIERYLANKWGITANHAPWAMICDGHSSLRGASENGTTANPMPRQLVSLKSANAFEHINYGIDGWELDDMIAAGATKIDPHLTNLDANGLLLIWAGSNDMGEFPPHDNQSGEVTAARMRTYCEARRAAGWTGRHKIVIIDEIPQPDAVKGAGFEAKRTAFHAILHADWPDYADALVEISANPTIGQDGDETNTTYYASGGHLINAGYAIVAQEVDAVLDTLGIT